ncbi:MAG: DivIVA domain-containing protein [Solirubrobacteraceae bacterium]
MALERQSIEKKDFPIGRRGYDPEAVDAHLSTLADEIDELKRSARKRTETLASSASEQVRAIVEAAETSAADIQRQAEEEAQEIRAEAVDEARSTREQATAQARDYVGKVSESTTVMLQRLDGMESELGALIESLRTGANRLNADLQLLEGNLTEVSGAVAPRPRFEAETAPASAEPAAVDTSAAADTSALAEPDVEPLGAGPVADAEPPLYEPEPAASNGADLTEEASVAPAGEVEAGEEADLGTAATVAAPDDTEGARLIALNMALNGTPREETERYLAENFELADRDGLLDEVYASVEG